MFAHRQVKEAAKLVQLLLKSIPVEHMERAKMHIEGKPSRLPSKPEVLTAKDYWPPGVPSNTMPGYTETSYEGWGEPKPYLKKTVQKEPSTTLQERGN